MNNNATLTISLENFKNEVFLWSQKVSKELINTFQNKVPQEIIDTFSAHINKDHIIELCKKNAQVSVIKLDGEIQKNFSKDSIKQLWEGESLMFQWRMYKIELTEDVDLVIIDGIEHSIYDSDSTDYTELQLIKHTNDR